MTFRASRSGARIREVPITFRDRRVGQSKMSRRIVVEALVVVVQLRAEELLGRLRGRGRPARLPSSRTSNRRDAGSGRVVPAGTAAGVRVVLDARPLQDPGRAPVTAAVPRLAARRPMTPRRSMASRSRSCLRSDLDDPTADLDAPRGRSAGGCCRRPGCCRSASQTVDPFLLRGASLGAAWRSERGGAARGRISHRRRRVAAHRTGPAGRRHAPGPGPVGDPGRLHGGRPRRGSAAGCGPSSCARRRRSSSGRRPSPARPGGCCGSGRSGSASCRSRHGRGSRRRPADDAAARRRLGGRRPRAPRSRRRSLPRLFRPLRRPPGPRRRSCGPSPRSPTAADPTDLAADAPWPPRVLLAGATPDDRASLARAAAREGVARRSPTPRRAVPSGSRRSSAALARRVAPRRLGRRRSRPRSSRSRPGRRSSRRRSGRCPSSWDRPGCSWRPATRTGWRRACARSGRTTGSTTGSRPRRCERATWERRTWSDVADATRRVYAEVGIRAS